MTFSATFSLFWTEMEEDYFEAVAIDDFHSAFHLWEDTHRDCLLTDALEIHFIDMKKFNALPDKDNKNNSLHRWLTFFDQNIANTDFSGAELRNISFSNAIGQDCRR